MAEQEDHRSRRCPKLGHDVRFGYCRTQEGTSVCPRILDCWWERFDVESFLRQSLPAQTYERLLTPSGKPKMSSIIELIEQAKKRCQQ